VEIKRVNLRDWFSDEELDECPRCGDRAALTIPPGWIICTDCGVVRFAVDDRDGDRAARRAA
jgi:hypothetical protein